jgi:hypothetical protein
LLKQQAKEDDAENFSLTNRLAASLDNKVLSSIISRDSDFSKMPYYVFANYIKKPEIRAEVIKGLGYDETATREELSMWLEQCEKD